MGIIPALLVIVVFSSCVLREKGTEKPAAPGVGVDAAEEIWGPRFPPGLPAEARRYLEVLAAAVSRQDGAFLLRQGEAAWDGETRGHYDPETRLALLFRTGQHTLYGQASTAPDSGAALPRLDIAKVRGIEYWIWAELGPLIEVRGRFVMKDGASVSCALLIVWRLREPKIQGLYP